MNASNKNMGFSHPRRPAIHLYKIKDETLLGPIIYQKPSLHLWQHRATGLGPQLRQHAYWNDK